MHNLVNMRSNWNKLKAAMWSQLKVKVTADHVRMLNCNLREGKEYARLINWKK